MFKSSITITKNGKQTDSRGRLLGNKCIREKLLNQTCVAIQKADTRGLKQFQEIGYEGLKFMYRFDFKTTDFTTLSQIGHADYIEYVDGTGSRHEYKIIDYETRSILGCNWITIYGENVTARDSELAMHIQTNVQSIP